MNLFVMVKYATHYECYVCVQNYLTLLVNKKCTFLVYKGDKNSTLKLHLCTYDSL
jgi:hypothetical protein